MIESLLSVVGQRGVDALAFLLAFALTALMDSVFHDKLPHDHGREFAVNGALSKGKARGSGLIFVLCIALVSLAFLPFKVEYVIYTILLIASMLSGYFDDAAETAWNEYKKGIIDFAIAIVAGVTYLNFNGCGVNFLQWSFTLPYAVYLLLIVILIWTSINVVNCTDGVDGLSASVAVVTIGTYLLAYKTELAEYGTAGVVFMGALLAYLWSNAKPSSLLMGDAGSRAMGFIKCLVRGCELQVTILCGPLPDDAGTAILHGKLLPASLSRENIAVFFTERDTVLHALDPNLECHKAIVAAIHPAKCRFVIKINAELTDGAATAAAGQRNGHGRCGRALQEGAAGHCFSHKKNLLLPYSVPLAYHILEFCQPKSAKNPPARSICTGGRSPQQYFVPSGQ